MTQTDEVAFAPARLAALLQPFAEIDDDRETWRVAYPLKEVLLLVTCATIASCDDVEMIVTWGEHNLDFLRQFGDVYHGVPCARWLRDLVNRIDPSLFARCFEAFVGSMWPDKHDVISIDGKTARRTHDKAKGLKSLHTLSAHPGSALRARKDQRDNRHPRPARHPGRGWPACRRCDHHRRHGLPSRHRSEDH